MLLCPLVLEFPVFLHHYVECMFDLPSWQSYPPEPEGVALYYGVYLPGYGESLSAALSQAPGILFKKSGNPSPEISHEIHIDKILNSFFKCNPSAEMPQVIENENRKTRKFCLEENNCYLCAPYVV